MEVSDILSNKASCRAKNRTNAKKHVISSSLTICLSVHRKGLERPQPTVRVSIPKEWNYGVIGFYFPPVMLFCCLHF